LTSGGVVDYEYSTFGYTSFTDEQIKYMSVDSGILLGCGYCPMCSDHDDKAIFIVFKLSTPSTTSSLDAM
jgi:hypothetical protein